MDEAAVHNLLSGRSRGIDSTLLRSGLRVASWGYALATGLRNLAYDRNWLAIHRAAVPVISIGNITTGGTGKTPFAAWLTNWCITAGHKPGLLSRGYHSLARSDQKGSLPTQSGNDEKLVLDRLCPGVPHIQQKDRVESAHRVTQEFGCNVLLLDDGFQHRRLHRDLDLVLVDSLQPWGYRHLLPRGLLRERMSGLRRAALVILTRADQTSPEQRLTLRNEIAKIRGDTNLVEVAFTPQRLVDANWQPVPLAQVKQTRVLGFCGIGNPEGFRQTVSSLGVASITMQPFADHHHYRAADLARLAEQAHELSVDFVLTTQKDLVKIPAADWHGPPLLAVEIGIEFISGKELLEKMLRELLVKQ